MDITLIERLNPRLEPTLRLQPTFRVGGDHASIESLPTVRANLYSVALTLGVVYALRWELFLKFQLTFRMVITLIVRL